MWPDVIAITPLNEAFKACPVIAAFFLDAYVGIGIMKMLKHAQLCCVRSPLLAPIVRVTSKRPPN